MGRHLNRARMSVSPAPGTGTFTLNTAVLGYQTFAEAGAVNATVYAYVAEEGSTWEYGYGTYTTSGTTLARTTILGSSSSGSAVNFGAGVIVTATPLVETILDPFNNLSDLNSAATARTNLALVPGTNVQAYDAGLLSIAGLTGAGVVTASGSDVFAMRNIGVAGATEMPDRAAGDTRWLMLSGGTMTGNITLVGDAGSSLQPVTKQQLDAAILSMGKRQRVRAATTANITIATALNNADTLDSVTLATGDLVLVKNQTAPAENGIYVVGVSPARDAQFDSYDEHPGSLVSVEEGTANADTLWMCGSNRGGTIDVTAISFTQLFFTAYTAGTGLGLAGNVFSIDSTVATVTGSQALTNKTFNGLTVTSTTGTFTLTSAKTLTVQNTLTFSGTDSSTVAFGAGGTAAYLANKLSDFASTSSTELLTVISTTTGTGNLVFATSPTLTQPRLVSGGYIADANGNEILIATTTGSAVNELTLANAATGANPRFTASGGDADVGFDFLVKGAGVYRFLASASGPTDVRWFEDSDNGTNYVSIIAPATLGANFVLTLPAATDTLVGLATTDTLTNKTLTTPVINGASTGTGVATAATASTLALRDANANLLANNFLDGYATTATAAGTTTLTVSSTRQQFFTGATTQTVTLPVTSTLALGHSFLIVNNSTGSITINSSGGNPVVVVAGSTSAVITCILTSGTTAASWSSAYLGSIIATGKSLTVSNSITLAGTDATTMTLPPASASLGYLNIPQNSQSAAYTTVLADSGKHILHPSADTTARTFTIDSNANVAYPVGTAITFVNQNGAGVVTIAITTDTMRLAGAGTTGSRTLAANGVATAIKVTSTEWIISGTGLT